MNLELILTPKARAWLYLALVLVNATALALTVTDYAVPAAVIVSIIANISSALGLGLARANTPKVSTDA